MYVHLNTKLRSVVLRPQQHHFLNLPLPFFLNGTTSHQPCLFPPLPFFAPLFLAPAHPPIQQRVVGTGIKHQPPPTTRA